MARWFGLAAFAGLFVATLVFAQSPIGDPLRGKEMALANCTGFHFVTTEQAAPPQSIGPSFDVLASDPAQTEFRLRVFLMHTPHPMMPNFIFTDQEADDLAAYILSLRK
jgi:mono/diheme cytochrome c family protein